MNIDNESAVISLERLKELEKTFTDVEEMKEDYKKKKEALRVNITVRSMNYRYDSSNRIYYDFFEIRTPEVLDEIQKKITILNSKNEIKFKDISDEIDWYDASFANMSFFNRLKHLFFPIKRN